MLKTRQQNHPAGNSARHKNCGVHVCPQGGEKADRAHAAKRVICREGLRRGSRPRERGFLVQGFQKTVVKEVERVQARRILG